MRPMRTRLTITAALATTVLALAACSASDPEPSPSATESSSPTATETDETEPTDDETSAEETEDVTAGAGDAACLQGTWVYTAEEVEKTFEEMMANTSGGGVINDLTVTGDATMTFDASTITQSYDPQSWAIKAGPETMNMEMVITMSGNTVGEYTVEGDLIRVSSIDVNDYSVTTEVLVDGEPMEGLGDLGIEDLVGETGSGLPEGQVRFACSGDELSLTAIVPDQPDFTFSYTLARQ